MTMVDQVFETYRKASASFMQMQQDLIKQWAQQWPSASMEGAGTSSEWYQRIQKRWRDFATDSLNMHRESLDSMYKAAIDLIMQAFRLSESSTPEDYQRAATELHRKMFETFKEQSEVQLKEMEKEVEKWFQLFPTNQTAERPTNQTAERPH
jgi:hypothetical protein